MNIKEWLNTIVKKTLKKIFPSYRVLLRVERTADRLLKLQSNSIHTAFLSKNPKKDSASSFSKEEEWDTKTLTANKKLLVNCFALEITETHKASFSEFRRCNTGKDIVIIATGPSMEFYNPINNALHIGVNKAFLNDKVALDYYFTTDYESRNGWFDELKNYNFIKFFGQYSSGIYRDRFQVTENILFENNGRRFFQGAPSEDIHLNIEYYPLMAFYSITFQALHFAIYTNPKRIYLVGCDCSNDGYFDGTKQVFANPPKWIKGYKKFKEFSTRFYPDTDIYSINPKGLKGLFKDIYTEDYAKSMQLDRNSIEIL